MDIPDRITAAWLNSLNEPDRRAMATSEFVKKLHLWAASHVTFLWWRRRAAVVAPEVVNNGTAFFLGLGEELFAVTAAHVYEGFLREKDLARGAIDCRLHNLPFDLQERIVGYRRGIDIATFKLTYDELATIGKQAIAAHHSSWPPPHPFSGQAALLVGFPGVSRLWTGVYDLNFGFYTALTPVNSAGDRQITCPFDRRDWVSNTPKRLPPEGMALGGLSGGPLFLPIERDGDWSLQLGGVISEAHTDGYETVASVPAHFIAFDGRINSEASTPVRFSVPGGR